MKKVSDLGTLVRDQADFETDREYELWSVPAFAENAPELIEGQQIGSAKLLVRAKDVLLCKINPRINRVWLVSESQRNLTQIASPEWLVFRCGPDVVPEWLVHYFSSPEFRDLITSEVSGATGSHTRAKPDRILNHRIKLPPLDEQRRIVAILDEAFEAIATATANAEKNLANARAVYLSSLNGLISPEPSWHSANLEHLVSRTQIGLVRSAREQSTEAGVRYVKMNNISNENEYLDEDVRRVEASSAEISSFGLHRGDLLFNTRNSHELVGKHCIFDSGAEEPTVFNNNIMRINFADQIDPWFAHYALQTRDLVDQLEKMKSGTTNVSAIYWKSLKNLRIRYPDVQEQRRLSNRFSKLRRDTHSLTDNYSTKFLHLKQLQSAILALAFSARLSGGFLTLDAAAE